MKSINGCLAMLAFFGNSFAADFLIPDSTPREVSSVLLSSIPKAPFTGFVARKASDGLLLVLAKKVAPEKFNSDEDWSTDLLFHNTDYVETNKIDPKTGRRRVWTCAGYWVAIRQVENNSVGVDLIVLGPKVSAGQEFNIHTFGFSRKWKPAVSSAEDVAELKKYLGEILASVRKRVSREGQDR